MEVLEIKDEPVDITCCPDVNSCLVTDNDQPQAANVSYSTSMLTQLKEEIVDDIFVKDGLENSIIARKTVNVDDGPFHKFISSDAPSSSFQEEETVNESSTNIRETVEVSFAQPTEEKPFLCPFCQFPYKFKKTLNRHIREFHERSKRFSCSVCDYTCSRKNHLTQHISSVHERRKPHQCMECKYSFSEKTHLNRHILSIHQKLKPYKCSHCNYAANQKGHLTKHIKVVHDNYGLFNCRICEYNCNDRSSLCRHILTVHDVQSLFECSQCLFTCNTKTDLDQHMTLIHVISL